MTATEAPAYACRCGCGRALADPGRDGYANTCRKRWHDQGRPAGGPRPPRTARREVYEVRLARLETLRDEGLTYAQAAAVMKVTKRMAEHYGKELNRRRRVRAEREAEPLWPARPTGPVVRWEDRAACRGHGDLFFGPDGERLAERQVREAAAASLCMFCPVRPECAASAGRHQPRYGVWAGVTEDRLVREFQREDAVA